MTRHASLARPAVGFIVMAMFAAVASGQVRSESDHFQYRWDDDMADSFPHADTLWSPLGEVSMTNSGSIPLYAKTVASWVEWAYECYEGDGFDMPGMTNVKIGEPIATGIVPDSNWVYIHGYDAPWWYLPTLMSHELFHAVQLQYWGNYNFKRPTFVEGMAVAMENTVVPEVARYQDFCYVANYKYGVASYYDHDFWDFHYSEYDEAYWTAVLWHYLMEHNSTGDWSRYPGTDFIRRFLEATGTGSHKVVPKSRLYAALDSLLDDQPSPTTLDAEMEDLAFTNLVRVYDNLDYDHCWGLQWDESFFRPDTGEWEMGYPDGAAGMDSIPWSHEYRVLDLTEESGVTELDDAYTGEYVVSSDMLYGGYQRTNRIYGRYGAEYWQYDADLKETILNAGGLSYDGPGFPYRLEVTAEPTTDTEPSYTSATCIRDDTCRWHLTGIRFDDDRTVAAGVAVTAAGPCRYDLRQTSAMYEKIIDCDRTYRENLDTHQVRLLGIEHGETYYVVTDPESMVVHQIDSVGTHLAVVAFATNPQEGALGDPTFNYAVEDSFQFNFRRYEDGFYRDHSSAMVTPVNENGWCNWYVQEAGEVGDYRLDLRRDEKMDCSPGMLLTLFDYDIEAAALPDLVVREWALRLDSTGMLNGKVSILNQGTGTVTGARCPILVAVKAWQSLYPISGGQGKAAQPQLARTQVYDTLLVAEPTVTLGRGESHVVDITDFDTGWDFEDEEDDEPGNGYMQVRAHIICNSAEGMQASGGEGGPLIMPVYDARDELLTTNNEVWVTVDTTFRVPGGGLPEAELAEMQDWFGRETESIVTAWVDDPDLSDLPADYGEAMLERFGILAIARRFGFGESGRDVRDSLGTRAPGRGVAYDEEIEKRASRADPGGALDALRATVIWVEELGMGEWLPLPPVQLSRMKNPAQIRAIVGDVLGMDRRAPAPLTRIAAAEESFNDTPGFGDANRDWTVDLTDALWAVNMMLGAVSPHPTQSFVMDLDGNRQLGIGDVLGMHELATEPESLERGPE